MDLDAQRRRMVGWPDRRVPPAADLTRKLAAEALAILNREA
jgi:hypothetical protein